MSLSFYNKIPGLLLLIDPGDTIIGVSDRWLRLFGYERAEVVGAASRQFFPDNSSCLAQLIYTPQLFSQGYLEELECYMCKHDGEVLNLAFSATPERDENGVILYTLVALRDVTKRKQIEQLLHDLSSSTSAVIGGDFFRSLIGQISKTMQAPYVFITECKQGEMTRVRTLASLERGTFVESAEWDVRGTTCEGVLAGKVTYFPNQLGLLYEEYRNKRDSYLGVPVNNSHGKLMGHLAVFDTKPTQYEPQLIAVLQIFAARAGAEIERKHAEEARQQAQTELRQLYEELQDYNVHLEKMVTERTQEIERRNQVSESLRAMVLLLNSERSLNQILAYIGDTAIDLLAAKSCAIYSLQDDQQTLMVQTTRGLPDAYRANLQFSLERSFLGQAILQRQPMVFTNLAAAFAAGVAEIDAARQATIAEHYQTLFAIPLLRHEQQGQSDIVYGGIALYYSEQRSISEEEISLALAFAAQAALAIENARLRQQVEQMAIHEERSRLARELHDSVTQSLYSLTLLAEGWRRMASKGRLEEPAEALAELGELGQQALKEMRLLIHELRPPALEKDGLLAAIYQRLNAVEKRSGVEARLLAQDTIRLPVAIETGLYGIAQEALNNALKHAEATRVDVCLQTESGAVILEITDNGKGFEMASALGNGGIGLTSMQERAQKMSADLKIHSTLGAGTTIVVSVKIV